MNKLGRKRSAETRKAYDERTAALDESHFLYNEYCQSCPFKTYRGARSTECIRCPIDRLLQEQGTILMNGESFHDKPGRKPKIIPWSAREERQLLQLYQETTQIEISRIMMIPEHRLKSKLREWRAEGIIDTDHVKRYRRPRNTIKRSSRSWSKKSERDLLELSKTLSNEELAVKFDRTVTGVARKLDELRQGDE